MARALTRWHKAAVPGHPWGSVQSRQRPGGADEVRDAPSFVRERAIGVEGSPRVRACEQIGGHVARRQDDRDGRPRGELQERLNDAVLRVDRGEARSRAPESGVPRQLGLKGREVTMPAINPSVSATTVESQGQNPSLDSVDGEGDIKRCARMTSSTWRQARIHASRKDNQHIQGKPLIAAREGSPIEVSGTVREGDVGESCTATQHRLRGPRKAHIEHVRARRPLAGTEEGEKNEHQTQHDYLDSRGIEEHPLHRCS